VITAPADSLAALPGWPCPSCGRLLRLTPPDGPDRRAACWSCGNRELYVQRDFPHWLGMGILLLACLASVITYSNYWIKTTWAILIGSAAVDAVLYLFMGTVTVCYRCRAQHRGFPANSPHQGFDLAIAEKYRQEKFRLREVESLSGGVRTDLPTSPPPGQP
jgi:hypothetical protein